MRFWISGPRLFGGLIRPGVSFGSPRWGRARNWAAVPGEFIYVIENTLGHQKIGRSVAPPSRKNNLQTGSSVPLRVAFSIFAADRAYDVEQEAHAILARHRLPGEWFDVPKDAAIASVYAAASRLGAPLGDDAIPSKAASHRSIEIPIILFLAIIATQAPDQMIRLIAWAVLAVLAGRRLTGLFPRAR